MMEMMMMWSERRRLVYILGVRYIPYLNVCQFVLCDLFCADSRMIENVPCSELSFPFLLS